MDQREIYLTRSLKRTLIVLWLIFRLDRPVGRTDVAEILDIDPKTAGDYLRSLARQRLITRTHYQDGWTLTAGGRQLILGVPTSPANLPAGDSPVQDLADQAPRAPQAHNAEDSALQKREKFPFSMLRKEGNWPPKRESFPLSEESEESLIKKDSLRIKDSSDSDSDSDSKGENLPILETRKILDATRLIFERPVLSYGIERAEPELALAWIAQAYDNRNHLDFPPGLVYQSLKKQRIPRRQYMSHPEDYLPDIYLRAVGLLEALEESAPEIVDGDSEEDGETDPALEIEIRPGLTAGYAWETARTQAAAEMPNEQRREILLRVKLNGYADGCFVLEAASQYERDYLDSRLKSTLKWSLCGICGSWVEVEFVFTGETE